MKQVVIVGAGGFGREVIEIFKDQNKQQQTWDILGYIDENPDLYNTEINNYPVLGGLEWLKRNVSDNLSCVVTIGSPDTRKTVVSKLEELGISFCNAIHPSVIMSEFVDIGHGVIICAGAILTVNITIGNHVHINTNTTIGHDAIIKDYSTITATVKITGNTLIEEGVYLGTASSILPGVSIGAWSTIGAGAVVVKDIPEKVVAVGIPAKVSRTLS